MLNLNFHSRIRLTPIESIKLGTKLICIGIESIKKQNCKPSTNEIKGFDECVFFIRKILKGDVKLDKNSCPSYNKNNSNDSFEKSINKCITNYTNNRPNRGL